MEIQVKTFLNRLEKCDLIYERGKILITPLYIRISDPDIDVDYAQTGWGFKVANGGVPCLVKLNEEELPSNYNNLRSTRDLISDIYKAEKLGETSLMQKPLFINSFGDNIEPLSNLFGKGGIHLGKGTVDLDILGTPTKVESDIVQRQGEYVILESISCNDSWTYGEIFTSGYLKVVLTGSPKYKTDFLTKEAWLAAHRQFIEVSNLRDADILFTDSLDSNTEKMRKARRLGIEIKEYIK